LVFLTLGLALFLILVCVAGFLIARWLWNLLGA
jgi:hypothetical protein